LVCTVEAIGQPIAQQQWHAGNLHWSREWMLRP